MLGGHGNGTFTPDKSMTRAEFASMLVKMLGLTATSDKTFGDVDADAWYADAVSKAVAAGIINGKNPDSFAPEAPVSFEEAAVMMCRAFGLAKTTSGDDWSKESIEKLTSLGMIGEGADEHLQVGVECSRAVVAALADTVVAEYVNEDRAEPITGEVKGVVLVVNQAKVELKDATVSAPIVAQSASVTLTNTKADNVVVGGNEAAVTADKDSSVADVTVSGTAPAVAIEGEVKGDVSIGGEAAKVELNGAVAGNVTVEETATGAEIKGDGVTADKVTNNSAEDVKVNDKTVEAKPDDTQQPDDTQKPSTPDVGGGNVGGGAGSGSGDTKPVVHQHKYTSEVTKQPSCTAEGVKTYTCTSTTGTCDKKTYTESIPKVEHDWGTEETGEENAKVVTCKNCPATKPVAHTNCTDFTEATVVTAATCTEGGTTVKYCTVCGKPETGTTPAAGHKYGGWETTKAATCGEDGVKSQTCSECGDVKTETISKDTVAHQYGNWETVTAATCKDKGSEKHTCSVCNHEETRETEKSREHNYGENDRCTVCEALKPDHQHDFGTDGKTDCKCGEKAPTTQNPAPGQSQGS